MPFDKIIGFLVGGLALFIYGMALTSEGLQKVAGKRLRLILEVLTANKFVGVGVGVFVTICTQSSSATTVMLVSLANSGLVHLAQTLPVILGADIGTTLTIQLIAFKVTNYALLLVAVGVAMFLLSRYERPKYAGQILMGFGFIFFGMALMQDGISPLQGSGWFRGQMMSFADNPLKGLIVSTAFTAVIQSSAATIAVALALASQGMLGATAESSLLAAVPIILGANIGTCATALLSSIGTNLESRRVAMAHLLFKVAGVIVFFPLVKPFARLVLAISYYLSPDMGVVRILANAHTVFNILITVLFVGFTRQFAGMVKKIIPEKRGREIGRLDFIDPSLLGSTELALRSARSGVEYMAGVVLSMLRDAMRVLRFDDENLLEDTRRKDEEVDYVHRRVSDYLVKIMRRDAAHEEKTDAKRMFLLAGVFEKLGNLVGHNLMEAFHQKISRDVEFSIEGQKELESFHSMIIDFLRSVTEMVSLNNPALADGITAMRREILREKIARQQSHLHRMERGLRDSRESDVYYMEILYVLDSIAYRATSVVHAVLGDDIEEVC